MFRSVVVTHNDVMRQLCVIFPAGADSGAATQRARIRATPHTKGQLPAQRHARRRSHGEERAPRVMRQLCVTVRQPCTLCVIFHVMRHFPLCAPRRRAAQRAARKRHGAQAQQIAPTIRHRPACLENTHSNGPTADGTGPRSGTKPIVPLQTRSRSRTKPMICTLAHVV
jgi:hypothetical protein